MKNVFSKNGLSGVILLSILIIGISCASKTGEENSSEIASRNKAIIKKGFEDWEKGTGNLFPLVADNIKWTIENYSEAPDGYVSEAKVYNNKQELVETDIKYLYSKLDGIIKPELKGIYAEGDMVVAYWLGTTKATDGLPFSNTYIWLMQMKDGKIVALTAFLNMNVMNKLLNR